MGPAPRRRYGRPRPLLGAQGSATQQSGETVKNLPHGWQSLILTAVFQNDTLETGFELGTE